MRVVLQRVSSASVSIDERVISSIGRGLVCLVGLSRDDGLHDAEWMARKLLNVRLWEEGKVAWKGSVQSMKLELLLVSQFTLYTELKGNKPDFHQAMQPTQAKVRRRLSWEGELTGRWSLTPLLSPLSLCACAAAVRSLRSPRAEGLHRGPSPW
jgi:D-tyrosyl-tRNA(Tyr) deacylase